MIDIQDNFLSDVQFRKVQEKIIGDEHGMSYKWDPVENFSWILSPIVRDYSEETQSKYKKLAGSGNTFKVDHSNTNLNNLQLVHVFYDNHAPLGSSFEILYPILEELQPAALIRIKANLVMCRDSIIESNMHTDIIQGSTDDYMKTSIFYLNTCNGYTKFENGDEVESVANRLVTFPQHFRHCGTTCTDRPFRSVINFNYVL